MITWKVDFGCISSLHQTAASANLMDHGMMEGNEVEAFPYGRSLRHRREQDYYITDKLFWNVKFPKRSL